MKWKTVVLAGSDILYHGTYPDRAVNILQDQAFHLKSSLFNEAEAKLGASLFYLSTARSLLSSYLKNQSFVIFELDGKRLATKHRIEPVNYFVGGRKGEMEDRVFSTSATLSTSYVKTIHVPVQGNRYNAVLKKLALKLRIPIRFYDASTLLTLKEPVINMGIRRLTDSTKGMGQPLSKADQDSFELLRALLVPTKTFQKHDVVRKWWRLLNGGPLSGLKTFESWIKDLLYGIRHSLSKNSSYHPVIERLAWVLRRNGWQVPELYLYLRAKLECAVTEQTYFQALYRYRETLETEFSVLHAKEGYNLVGRWTGIINALGGGNSTGYKDPLVGERQVHKDLGYAYRPVSDQENQDLLAAAVAAQERYRVEKK
jgi:hypothetical protein